MTLYRHGITLVQCQHCLKKQKALHDIGGNGGARTILNLHEMNFNYVQN